MADPRNVDINIEKMKNNHRKLIKLSKDNDLKQVNIRVKQELSPAKQSQSMGPNEMLKYHDKIIQEAKRIKDKIKKEKKRLR
jgi:hypothetical protein